MKRKDVSTELKRVALYIRVSGEEQKIHGLSLEAQQERLETYARERGWIITGFISMLLKPPEKTYTKEPNFNG